MADPGLAPTDEVRLAAIMPESLEQEITAVPETVRAAKAIQQRTVEATLPRADKFR
jgi:hypothetical protein